MDVERRQFHERTKEPFLVALLVPEVRQWVINWPGSMLLGVMR